MQRFFIPLFCVLLLCSCSRMNALKKAGAKIKSSVMMCTQKLHAADVNTPAVAADQPTEHAAPAAQVPSFPSRYNWDAKMAIW